MRDTRCWRTHSSPGISGQPRSSISSCMRICSISDSIAKLALRAIQRRTTVPLRLTCIFQQSNPSTSHAGAISTANGSFPVISGALPNNLIGWSMLLMTRLSLMLPMHSLPFCADAGGRTDPPSAPASARSSGYPKSARSCRTCHHEARKGSSGTHCG